MRQKTNKKNGGFTLVEILIAITILGIIVVPFMHSFVTASRTNAKSKKLQNATALASNLMEEIKANSIEDLAFQFNYPVRGDGTTRFDIIDADAFMTDGVARAEEVLLKNGAYESPVKYNASLDPKNVTASVLYEAYQTGDSEEYEYLGQASGKYYFMMKGVTSGTGTYDALVTMDATAYKTNSLVESLKGHNDKVSPVIDSLDVRKDAFYVPDEDELIEGAAVKIAEGTGVDSTTLHDGNLTNGELKRTITITIEKEGSVTTVTRRLQWVVKNGSLAGKTYDESLTFYSNAESPGYDLRSIYVFYTPNYASSAYGSSVADEFIINNPDNVDTELYIVKQKYSSFNTSEYKAKESAYYCKVFVNENVGSYTPSTHKAHIALRTNLVENIYDENVALYYKYDLTYNNMEGSQPNPTSSRVMLDEKSLDAERVRDRIYEVTVAVYEEGQADEDFSGSPVAVITGSKDN